jgi:hypothetical protein
MKRLTLALAACAAFSTVPAFAVGGLADITIVERATGRTLPLYQSDGRWYVPGRPGTEYEIRVRNNTGADVLTVISVDGVNVVSGETAAPSQTGYVLGPWRQFDVKGWRKDLNRVASFYFTRLDDSYAARTGRPDNVGVIGVAVFRRKPEPPPAALEQEAPRYEGPTLRDRRQAPASAAPSRESGAADSVERSASAGAPSAKAENSLGTGHGRQVNSTVRYTSFERESDAPNEVISIWYDSHANLVARGVIPQPKPRDPQPFPAGFVADPPRS